MGPTKIKPTDAAVTKVIQSYILFSLCEHGDKGRVDPAYKGAILSVQVVSTSMVRRSGLQTANGVLHNMSTPNSIQCLAFTLCRALN